MKYPFHTHTYSWIIRNKKIQSKKIMKMVSIIFVYSIIMISCFNTKILKCLLRSFVNMYRMPEKRYSAKRELKKSKVMHNYKVVGSNS